MHSSSHPRPRLSGYAYLDDTRARQGGILAFAHRGGAKHPELVGLENTLRAFQHAHAMGFDYLETDVHLTRDGELVVFHDHLLDRVSDGIGPIADLTLAQVRRVRVGGREPIPTLDELLDALPDARFNIDIKVEAALVPLARLILRRGDQDRILVGSFSGRSIRRFRRVTRGRIATSASRPEVMAYRLLPSGWLADLITGGRFQALQVPFRRRYRGVSVTVATSGLVRRAHRRGKQVHVWTIDDPAEMTTLLERGVDGLMTDRTDLLRDLLVGRGVWPNPM